MTRTLPLLAFASAAAVSIAWILVERPGPHLILYNVPITLPFFALGWEVLLARRWRRDAGVFLVWLLGGAVLYARFTGLAVVSGHVTWCVLMAAQARLRRVPAWITVAVWLVALETLAFKIYWSSWADTVAGLLAGGVLASLLWRAHMQQP